MSIKDINILHSKKLAVKDKIYTDENNIRYIGLKDGRIKKLDSIEGEIKGDQKSSKINNIGVHTRKEVIDNLTQVGVNKTDIASLGAKKSDKAFVIAMSIIF